MLIEETRESRSRRTIEFLPARCLLLLDGQIGASAAEVGLDVERDPYAQLGVEEDSMVLIAAEPNARYSASNGGGGGPFRKLRAVRPWQGGPSRLPLGPFRAGPLRTVHASRWQPLAAGLQEPQRRWQTAGRPLAAALADRWQLLLLLGGGRGAENVAVQPDGAEPSVPPQPLPKPPLR